jgi:hypothetical protein
MLWFWLIIGYVVSIVLSWLMFRKSISMTGYSDWAQVIVTFVPVFNLCASLAFMLKGIFEDKDSSKFFNMK